MSDSNGVIKIGFEGVKKFQFEGGKPFEVDVVREHDLWVEIDDSFRAPDGSVPKEKLGEWRRRQVNFAREVIQRAANQLGPEEAVRLSNSLSDAQCVAFMGHLSREVTALKGFFESATGKEPSPDQPSASDTVFTE